MPKLARTTIDAGLVARLVETVEGFNNVSRLADQIGRSEGAVRKWMRGESQPNATDVALLCGLCSVSPEWLLIGTGPKKWAPTDPENPRYMASLIGDSVREIALALDGAAVQLPPAQWADLVTAVCMLSARDERVEPEAVRLLVRAVTGRIKPAIPPP